MVTSVFNIAVAGLSTAQAGLSAISNNISNASTKGYSRQDIIQTAAPGVFSTVGYFGNGSEVQDVRRSSSEFLNQRLNEALASESYYQTYSNQIAQIDGVLSDDENGVSAGFTGFFTALQDLTVRPGDSASRESVMTAARTVAARLNGVDSTLNRIRDSINDALQGSVDAVNANTAQLADLNMQITDAINRANGATPNELLDKRDMLLQDLSKYVQTTVVNNADGTFDVYLSNGQPLVNKTKSTQLDATRDPFNPQNISVGLRLASGADEKLVIYDAKALGMGQIAGLMQMRDTDLNRYQATLGVVAGQFASKINDIQSNGYDLSGGFGQPFFAIEPSLVSRATTNQSSATASISSLDYAKATGKDFEVINDAGTIKYRTANTRDNFVEATVISNGDPGKYSIGYELEFTLTGPLSNGDKFLLAPTRAAASTIRVVLEGPSGIAASTVAGAKGDASNLQKMAKLQTDPVVFNAFGSEQQVTITAAFNQLISKVGNRTREIQNDLTTRTAVRESAEAQQQDMSGVNLDEEAAKLLQYQQAYQASGRVVAMSKDLFDQLIAAIS
jgi:flagellar hook-associated protein 1 FlgK